MPQKRVGGSVRWGSDREPPGKNHTHQQSRAPGRLPGSEMLCQGQKKSDHTPQDGQNVSSDVHQQAWENDLPTAEQPGQRAMTLVHGEKHPPQGPVPGWCPEHHYR